MASEAQIVANRVNAVKSTGPRTGEGKGVVAQNAVKHGLLGRQDVIRSEDQGAFDLHRERMLGELAPVGSVESVLAERVVSLSWRLKRVGRMQNETIDTLITGAHRSPLSKRFESMMPRIAKQAGIESNDEGGDLVLGCMAAKDFANHRVLDRLLMYERRIEHSLYRGILEIQRLRLIRQMDPAERETDSERTRVAAHH